MVQSKFPSPGLMSRRAFSASLVLTLGSLAACAGEAKRATLRIGDQGKILQLPLELSRENNKPSRPFEFTTFTDGPNMNAAFLAGALDAGFMGDTPALFASAAGADVVAVAAGRVPPNVYYQLVARPGSGVSSLADLKGKRIAFTKSTALHGYLLLTLEHVGLSQEDIEPIDVPIVALSRALESGHADAALLGPPLLTSYIAQYPGAVALQAPDPAYSVVLASRHSLADGGTRDALLDFTKRSARAGRWINANLDVWRKQYYEGVLHQDAETARILSERQGADRVYFAQVHDDLRLHLQRQANALSKAGLLPEADKTVAQLFDPAINEQFNKAIEEAVA